MTDASEILELAKKKIEISGWWMGPKRGGIGECIITSLSPYIALSGRKKVDEFLMKATGVEFYSDLGEWNDTRESVEEIFAAFDRAIELAKADE